MLSWMRVTGISLSPSLNPGDFILVLKGPLARRTLRMGDIVVFHHTQHGVLVKRVVKISEDGTRMYVSGENPDSIDSRTFGEVETKTLIGKVLCSVRRPRKPNP